MPIYEYQGNHYDLDETDPVAAKAKIVSHLSQTIQKADTPSFLEEGYLGRVAKAGGEALSKAFASKEDVAAEKKYYPDEVKKEEPTPSIGEALSGMGKQLVEHPLDALVGLGKGLAADPELLFPALWEAAPAKLVAALERAGTAARVAETTARAGTIGAVAETGAGLVEGKVDPQKVANTAATFGILGGTIKGAGELGSGALKGVKDTFIKDVEPPKEVDLAYAETKMRPDETVREAIHRNQEAKRNALDENEATMGESKVDIAKEADKKIEYLNNPPKDYHPKDTIEIKNWAEKQLKVTSDEDARVNLQILSKQADDIIEGDQHPSVVREHGIVIKRNGNYIDSVEVPKELQKQGLGSKIVENLESDIKGEGHKSVFLIAKPESVEFWKKQGYTISSEGKEGIQMSKSLEESHIAKEENRPVTLDDKVPPKYLYHGTKQDITSLIDENGNLVLKPSKNFGGKTTSISLTHNEDFANDYAARVKGARMDGEPVFDFGKAKVIKIESNSLPEGISRESGEEWAFNVDKPIIIPKDKFSVTEHPLKDKKEYNLGKPPESWGDWLRNQFDREYIHDIENDPQLGKIYQEKYYEDMSARDPIYAEHRKKQKAVKTEFKQAKDKLTNVVNQRISGTYKEPPVEWNKAPKQPLARTDEARATKDGLNAVKEKEKINTEVNNEIAKEDQDHSVSLREAANVIGDAMGQIRALSRRAKIWGETINKLIPDVGVRGRATRAAEGEKWYDKLYTDKEKAEHIAGMDEAIAAWSIRLPKEKNGISGEEQLARLKMVRNNWNQMPSEEHAIPVLKKIETRLKEIGDKAVNAKLIDSLRTNYITHVLDFSKTKMTPIQQQALLDKIFGAPKESKLVKDFTVARKYEFLRELEKAVEGTGVIVHTDIAIIAEAYEKSMLEAIIHKKMVDHFKETIAPNKKPYLVPITQEALKEGYVSFQGKGSTPLEGLLVHPDLVDTMGFMFKQNDPSAILKGLGAISHLTKTLNTIASLFHATNLGVARLTADPVGGLKEIFTGGAGIRAAVDAFRTDENHTLINGFIEDGLMAGSEDIKRTIVSDIGAATDKLLSRYAPKDTNIKAAQYITNPLDRIVMQNMNSFTWDYMHTGQKLNLAMSMFSKVKAKNPELPDVQIRKEISRFINNTFGGLNWIDIANQVENKYLRAFAMKAANVRGREWAQILMFAPDWTVSTLRSFTSALPKEAHKVWKYKPIEGVKGMWNPTTQADFARRYVLNTAIGYLTIQNGINIAMSGHPIWENKDPTKVDNGDGTTTQVAKHSMETAEWVRDPTKTFGNKLGFIPKAVYVEISGHAYPSIDAPKLKPLYSGYGGMELAKAKAIALTASPFQISAGVQAPEGQKLKRGIMSAIGMPTYGLTKKQLAESIKKGKQDAEEKRREERMKK